MSARQQAAAAEDTYRGSDGSMYRVHRAGPDDTSPAHRTYPHGYDSRCGWCYLNASHSEDAHAAKLRA